MEGNLWGESRRDAFDFVHKWKYRSRSASLGPFVSDQSWRGSATLQSIYIFCGLSWLPRVVYLLPPFPCQNMLITRKLLRHHEGLFRRPNHQYTGSRSTPGFFFFFFFGSWSVLFSCCPRHQLLVVLTLWFHLWPGWWHHKPNPSSRYEPLHFFSCFQHGQLIYKPSTSSYHPQSPAMMTTEYVALSWPQT